MCRNVDAVNDHGNIVVHFIARTFIVYLHVGGFLFRVEFINNLLLTGFCWHRFFNIQWINDSLVASVHKKRRLIGEQHQNWTL